MMQVRVKTSPLGMCFRIIGLLIVGGLVAVVVEHGDWYQAKVAARQPAAVVQPTPTPVAVPAVALAPAPVKATVHHPSAATPPGWTNFAGIHIPPPGYNDR